MTTTTNPERAAVVADKNCAWCGEPEIRETLDGDPLCQSCCNKWVAGNRTEDWSDHLTEQETEDARD